MVTGISVTPPGAVIATPDCTTKGCPFDKTRMVPTTHCPVTHGGTALGTPGHPAIVHGAAMVAVGMPLTSTRALGAAGIACPPCRHITTAPWCNRNPAT
jgi:hypothetical protein